MPNIVHLQDLIDLQTPETTLMPQPSVRALPMCGVNSNFTRSLETRSKAKGLGSGLNAHSVLWSSSTLRIQRTRELGTQVSDSIYVGYYFGRVYDYRVLGPLL